jgi:IKI3 family
VDRLLAIQTSSSSCSSASSHTESASDRVTADKALRYLMLLVDVSQLYKVALGMYDFDLVCLGVGACFIQL